MLNGTFYNPTKILFGRGMEEKVAGVHNMFPFLNIETPKCINLKRLRCPDWLENIYYSVDTRSNVV